MSQWLAEIFEKQSSSATTDAALRENTVPALAIEYHDRRFVCDFEYLSEVIETDVIIPYPENRGAHVGIINMRGEVVPVYCLHCLLSGEVPPTGKPIHSERMIVFRVPDGAFAICADKVQKRLISPEAFGQSSEIEIEGKIHKILSHEFFSNIREMIA